MGRWEDNIKTDLKKKQGELDSTDSG